MKTIIYSILKQVTVNNDSYFDVEITTDEALAAKAVQTHYINGNLVISVKAHEIETPAIDNSKKMKEIKEHTDNILNQLIKVADELNEVKGLADNNSDKEKPKEKVTRNAAANNRPVAAGRPVGYVRSFL